TSPENASSLEEPDAEPQSEQGADAQQHEPAAPQGDDEDGSSLEQHEEQVLYVKRGSRQRRPKYGTFGVLGGLIGLIAGLVLAQVGTIPPEQDYSRIDLSLVLVGLGVPAGILLALLIALILDRRRS